ncbi:cystathionine beta-lyase [Robbsia sp. Bb-Pol-6]|uniref:Cystathionine beta-lyase n=1 Tax=Robbsia betulipollinis TaxID=2981849 RepID=A0ABT3ZNE0_9BURK|nr:cystathionine beta-lyase [Robbsia betulipollinis]MCY0388059.1 cystathionine beta-lyase [Robbsia betulipollinis]
MSALPADTEHLQTRLLHEDVGLASGFVAFPTPVYRASTVVFPDLATLRDFDLHSDDQWRYGLHQTPTSATLARRLAMIEGGEFCLLQPSGLAAISNVYFALVKQGDDVLVPDNAYQPNRDHGDWLARDFGITVRYYDPMIGAGIRDLIQPNTRLIWIEAPGSVTMEVPDVPAITAVAREAGAVTAIDNTYSAGLGFKPFDHGCDISMQALTKYQSGGSDVLMGALITRDAALHARLKLARMRLGLGVSQDDCSLVLRSLATLALRYGAHDRAALGLATWLKLRPEVSAVLHPGLPDCPGHACWRRDFSHAGGLFSVVFNETYTPGQIDAFVEGLRLFKIGFSWGGAYSLAVPYALDGTMRTARAWEHKGTLVRFFVGLESDEDLRADLEQSLVKHLGA